MTLSSSSTHSSRAVCSDVEAVDLDGRGLDAGAHVGQQLALVVSGFPWHDHPERIVRIRP